MQAELINDRLIVWNFEDSRQLYKIGFFGKPIGIPKPKNFDFNAPLTLDLIEGLYLAKEGIIEVFKGRKKVSINSLESLAKKYHERFEMKYKVYSDLRKKNYVVTPGIKFGCDFAVYEHGPGYDHAPFILTVKSNKEEITATELVRAGRLATTVKKKFVFAIVDSQKDTIDYLVSKWWKT
ncbi:MAG: tRNA-intron lyase [Candidatus Brockarchaeota archaeon]|nr:tRNA-intron lyase [Candidatus Brockarchaeota archaeon]MBO3763010.1 tRNA-intron lyase [Candidatus Brockarchaeota archaeon]MBO3768545.1 tRNA-intron lyase [Candidatus Brockarchaeota archaeon]MBO3800822.1 tRNA-intron lyase [Candidatus Brockarchaeota archaeon]